MNKILGTLVSFSVAGGLILAAAPESQAAPSLRVRAAGIAEKQVGDPYRYGAAGPDYFDCSGLVKYSFGKVGKKLPRTAQSQYDNSHHISGSSVTKGDLVFIGKSSRSIYHVGVYAGFWSGKSWMWNANTGAYRGRKVVLAPVREYTVNGATARFGRY